MTTKILDDWELIQQFLPEGWEAKATELGALVRKRKVKDAETLLRVLLIHLADGKSLRTTVAYANEVGLCAINDVALLHRLRASEEWLRWMVAELFQHLHREPLPSKLFQTHRIRLVDGSSISEAGSAGTDWRLHYAFLLSNLRCDTFQVTSVKTGETFQRYAVAPGDLLIGDRGYCQRKGIMHVFDHQGHVLVRFHSTNLPLLTKHGQAFTVLEHLRGLDEGQVGDWNVWMPAPDGDRIVKGRVCACRKDPEAAENAKKALRKMASKKGRTLRPETLEHAEYITVFTTTTRHVFKGQLLLSLYRGRWQIELIFKRLKGLLSIGALPKYHPESCLAWLYGKMLIALVAERLYQEAETFSPWGGLEYAPQASSQKYTDDPTSQKPLEGI